METKPDYKAYYTEKLEQGLEFQDFIMAELHYRGIVLQPLSSKKNQLKAENMLGLEIKFDDKASKTGNLWIETHEKSNPQNCNYAQSGILKDDNSWLFGIGNREVFYIFSKLTLKQIYEKVKEGNREWGGIEWRENKTKTSMGLLMPISKAQKFASKIVSFQEAA